MKLLDIKPVRSGDKEPRYLVRWLRPHFKQFLTSEQLREIAYQLLMLIKHEPHSEWRDEDE